MRIRDREKDSDMRDRNRNNYIDKVWNMDSDRDMDMVNNWIRSGFWLMLTFSPMFWKIFLNKSLLIKYMSLK